MRAWRSSPNTISRASGTRTRVGRIDNRGGAGGNIGAEIAAKANPDGYTLFIVSSSITSNVALYQKLPFDLERDFAPVSTLVTGAYALVVHPSLPAASVHDLIQLAKAQPRKLNFSSFGQVEGARRLEPQAERSAPGRAFAP
ncbi:MAG: tripartite tricarboxylate transporter substrate-binding protein [Burkholderiales bacterium]